MSAGGPPVHLVKGSDPVLLRQATSELVDRLVGDADRNEVLSEFSGDDYELGEVVMAATTVSMFGGDRVVVARNAARFGADDVRPLVDYLSDPSPDAVLVISWDRPLSPNAQSKQVPKALDQAIKSAGGEVHNTSAPTNAKARGTWIDRRLADSPVRLTKEARQLLVDRLGEDVGRLDGVLTVLEAVHGTAQIGPDGVEPYVGGPGAVPPWDLTDAIDSGDVPGALTALGRMLDGGERHPLQVMVTLQSYVERLLRLDGSGARTENDAAGLLGMKPYPAKKVLAQARRLGHDGVVRAVKLVAEADVDLRGRSGQDPRAVIETLVARLAALSSRSGASRSGGRRAVRPGRPR